MTKRVVGLVGAGLVAVGPFLAWVDDARACTTAVLSGKVTADGRPLLWKSRDAEDLHNQVVYLDDGRYPYLGVVNQGDAGGFEIWAGINSAGFAIMNSASYNLGEGDSLAEGQLMKVALQSCRTVADFERLLERTNATGKRDTLANFGVIDAEGGAAYFEVSRTKFVRFDATDPERAPQGFLVRTNFSDSGAADKGSGLIRRERAAALVEQLFCEGALAADTLLDRVARDVSNLRTGALLDKTKKPPAYAYVGDSINRDNTASVALVEGVRPGEDPRLSTLWVLLGQPVSGVAVPLWVAAGEVPAELSSGKEPAPMNAAFDRVRGHLYPTYRGDMKRYLRVAALEDPRQGTRARLLPLERAAFARAREALALWRTTPPTPAEQAAAQRELSAVTLRGVEEYLARVVAKADGSCVPSACFELISARASVSFVEAKQTELAGVWKRDSYGLSGSTLYLFADSTFVYSKWADVMPETVYDKGHWSVADGAVVLSSDADIAWDPECDRRFLGLAQAGQAGIVLFGLDQTLAEFRKATADVEWPNEDGWVRHLSLSRDRSLTLKQGQRLKATLLSKSWNPEFFKGSSR